MYANFQLEAQHLLAVQRHYPLFQPLNFTLANGHILLLQGANGIGKTTCLRTLAGLLPPAAGKIYWNQQENVSYRHEYLQSILYLGHHAGIKLALTPLENLQLSLILHQDKMNIEKLLPMLDQMQLLPVIHTPCRFLSAGQQRRVAFSRLLCIHTALWILDEPFAALDQAGIILLHTLFSQHIAKGGSIILTSHQHFAIATQTIELKPWEAPCD